MIQLSNVSRNVVRDIIGYVYGPRGKYSKRTQRQVFGQMSEYNRIVYLLLQMGW